MDHNGGPEPAREGPQGLPGAGGPMGFLPGFPQLQLGGLVPVLPPPRTFPAPIGVPVGGDVGRAPPVKCPFELSLRDPDFYHRLMTECSKEEKMVSQQRGGEYHAPKFITDYLKRNDVRPLKKRSQKFPHAQYYCRLCDYHCDTLTICISHIKDNRHSRLARMQEIETTLYHLPKPSRHHLETLQQLLVKVEKEMGINGHGLKVREEVAAKIHFMMTNQIPGSLIRLYGSCYTGFGLKDSSLNLDLQLPEGMKPHLGLIEALSVLSTNSMVSNVVKDFSSKIPMIFFTVDGLRCELSLNNNHAFQTSRLLRDYIAVDPRVKTLAVAIRFWARLCLIDRQAEGTLPAHAFDLLLVFFMQQQTKPVLPCIHEYLEDRDAEVYETPVSKLSKWKTRCNLSASELLIEFFEFYALGFCVGDFVVSVRQVGGISKDEKQWKGKKLAIEDPYSIKRPLTRSVNSLAVLDYITDCFKIAYLYFGTVQTRNGPVITKILVPDATSSPPPVPNGAQQVGASPAKEGSEKENENVQDLLKKLTLNKTEAIDKKPAVPAGAMTLEELERSMHEVTTASPAAEDEDEEESGGEGVAAAAELGMGPNETFDSFTQKVGRELTPKQARRVSDLVPKNMILFQFDGSIFSAGQTPALMCTVCNAEGHLQSNCPEEQLPPARPLPPMPPQHREVVIDVCYRTMMFYQPKEPELRARDRLVKDLEFFIQQKCSFPTARIDVFGSSHNGFAFECSDLDISLTFTDREESEVDAIGIIERLAEKLKRMNGIRNIQAITSAKVPIIKFVHYPTQIEADISLYNVLAQENTSMLRFYAAIDERVKVLGYMTKLFAKKCEIGDASRGSLSSYAYILMLIHYLQQCNPPVLPVLQELYDRDGEKPVNMVDGWNAWFFRDEKRLALEWRGIGQNKADILDLWLGFLRFYCQDFDERNLVVCIRQRPHLTKFEKMWNSHCIAIEDPFDLSHNLGAGISRKMNLFIKKAFMMTRERFGMMPRSVSKGYREFMDYFWDHEYLRDGVPPNDRGCRACGKIGHIVRDCPRRKNAEERKKREAEQRRKKNDAERIPVTQMSQQELQQQRRPIEPPASAAPGFRDGAVAAQTPPPMSMPPMPMPPPPMMLPPPPQLNPMLLNMLPLAQHQNPLLHPFLMHGPGAGAMIAPPPQPSPGDLEKILAAHRAQLDSLPTLNELRSLGLLPPEPFGPLPPPPSMPMSALGLMGTMPPPPMVQMPPMPPPPVADVMQLQRLLASFPSSSQDPTPTAPDKGQPR